MKRFFSLGLPLLVALSLCLISCNPKAGKGDRFGETAFITKSAGNSFDHSEVLSLRLLINDTYCKQTACSCIHYLAAREYEDVLALLKKDYNIDLELVYCIEEYYLEDSIKTMKYDGVICKPWFAFQFQADYGMKLKRIADIVDPFENVFLAGTFIVKTESLIKEPKDLQGKTIVFGEENSFEKYHAAMHQIKDADIVPEKVINLSSCTEGINALLDNLAEVAVISDYALIASCAADFAEEDAFRTVWQTEDMPLCSLILDLNKVKEADAARLQSALLEISKNKIPESFASQGFVEPMSWIPNPYSEESMQN